MTNSNVPEVYSMETNNLAVLTFKLNEYSSKLAGFKNGIFIKKD